MDDARLDELLFRALDPSHPDSYFDLIEKIGRDTPRWAIFERSVSLSTGTHDERELAVGLLGSLTNADSNLRARVVEFLHKMLDTNDSPRLLATTIIVLSNFEEVASLEVVIRHSEHVSADVRLAVAKSLARFLPNDDDHTSPDQQSKNAAVRGKIVDTFIRLMSDSSLDVRDWASFAFTNELESDDSPEIRTALRSRVRDLNKDAQAEAILALALRKDLSVVPVIEQLLQQRTVGQLILDAVDALDIAHLKSLAEPFRD